MAKVKVYLASPYGFTNSGRVFMKERMEPALEKLGLQVLNPWDMLQTNKNEIAKILAELKDDPAKMYAELEKILFGAGKKDLEYVDDCDFLLAILDGSDQDSGVALEIGYAFAKGKKLFGYRSDYRQSGDAPPLVTNVMLEYCIVMAGGQVISDGNDNGKDDLAPLTDALKKFLENGLQ